jgi:hypothetical protein
MGNAIILGLPSSLAGSTATSSASAVAPVANILTDEPSDKLRINSVDPSKTWVKFVLDYNYGYNPTGTAAGRNWPFEAIALVNHNLTRGTGNYSSTTRYSANVFAAFTSESVGVAGYDATGTIAKLPPDSLVSSTNATGTYTDVDDDPFSPDSNNIVPTADVQMITRFSFATPAATLTPGADAQAFYVLVAPDTAHGRGGGQIKIELWEGGGSLLSTIVNDDSVFCTRIVEAYWNASLLATSSGIDVQLRIESTGLIIKAVEWQAMSIVTTTNIDYVTGNQALPVHGSWTHKASYATLANVVGPEPTQNFAYALPAVWDASCVGLFIRDPNNTAGYVQAGHFVAGPMFRPAVNIEPGDLVTIEDDSARGRTRGGQNYGSQRRRRRKVFVRCPNLTTTEGWRLFDRLQWRKGMSRPVFVALYPDDATAQLHTSVWGTLSELTPLASNTPVDTVHSMSFAITEKL